MRKAEIDLSPTDRAALFQARELQRRSRAIKQAYIRLTATVFAGTVKRYMELVREAREILQKEATRIYQLTKPVKKVRKLRKMGRTAGTREG